MMAQRRIAIIGMASQFPGTDGIDAYWRQLVDGVDAVGQVPSERWDSAAFTGDAPGQAGRTYSSAAGMDAMADCYDAAFFGLDVDEARRIDPQQGRILELAWHACEDAGIVPDTLNGQEVGVFIGVSTRDFDRRMAGLWPHLNAQTSTGASAAIVANRLSYLFGLTGPSIVVDSACASSLSSIHMACMALENEECTMAFAGGVQLILSPANMIAFAQNGLLARDGRCKPFSRAADGYVCGEGAGLLLLKPLDLALRDGDFIRAVIGGSAINHNGRSNGLSAPYRAGQQRVIAKALSRAGISGTQIDYVEAHAPGTRIGDAIEMQALRDVYGAGRPSGRPCFVGSVKSNIGHLEAAAGIAALIKAALMVERGKMPASLHCHPLSELLRLNDDALQVCQTTRDWLPGDAPRTAAVSAFSFGGGNAHVIVTQAPAAPAAVCLQRPEAPWVLAVSARTEAAFSQLCARYADSLRALRQQGAADSALRDFCCATLARRQHHAFRRAFVISNWKDAIAALDSATAAPPGKGGLLLGVLPAEFASDSGAGVTALPPAWRALASECDALPGTAGAAGMAVLAALLRRLGFKRMCVDQTGDSPILGILSDCARHVGLTVDASATEGLSVLDASVRDVTGDALWRPAGDLRGQCVALSARLFEQGFALRWQALAELDQARPVRLPLYPFERRRNHVIPDQLSMHCAASSADPSLPHLSSKEIS